MRRLWLELGASFGQHASCFGQFEAPVLGSIPNVGPQDKGLKQMHAPAPESIPLLTFYNPDDSVPCKKPLVV